MSGNNDLKIDLYEDKHRQEHKRKFGKLVFLVIACVTLGIFIHIGWQKLNNWMNPNSERNVETVHSELQKYHFGYCPYCGAELKFKQEELK